MPVLRQPPAPKSASTLAERVEQIASEIQAIIDDRIDSEVEGAPGVPRQVIAQMVTAKWGRCSCEIFRQMQIEKLTAEERAKHDEAEALKAHERLSREWREAQASMGEQP